MTVEPVNGKTPHDVFQALRGLPRPFIISTGGEYTCVGADPFITVETGAHGTHVVQDGREGARYPDPFGAVSAVLSAYRRPAASTPFPFSGGGVGYFSYDLKDLVEPGRFSPRPAKEDLLSTAVPLCSVGFYDTVFVYDNRRAEGFLISHKNTGYGKRLDIVRERILSLPEGERRHGCDGSVPGPGAVQNGAGPPVKSSLTREEYVVGVKKALEYIAAGDIYQINLSQRLELPWAGDPYPLYASLAASAPARFSSFMDFGAFSIISNSPERFFRASGGIVEIEPIKGTRPRGRSEPEDLSLAEGLRRDPKEMAEHLMIVDLERSDIGRVALAGTVEVTGFARIETYPSLHHMVSTVGGRLRPGMDPVAAMRECFPGGSITGAPKIRAMEIIDELEPTARGVYTGAVGWMDFTTGAIDMAMAIRTAVHSGSTLFLSVGAGIVADSDPEREYDETMLKAADFLRAAGGAGAAF